MRYSNVHTKGRSNVRTKDTNNVRTKGISNVRTKGPSNVRTKGINIMGNVRTKGHSNLRTKGRIAFCWLVLCWFWFVVWYCVDFRLMMRCCMHWFWFFGMLCFWNVNALIFGMILCWFWVDDELICSLPCFWFWNDGELIFDMILPHFGGTLFLSWYCVDFDLLVHCFWVADALIFGLLHWFVIFLDFRVVTVFLGFLMNWFLIWCMMVCWFVNMCWFWGCYCIDFWYDSELVLGFWWVWLISGMLIHWFLNTYCIVFGMILYWFLIWFWVGFGVLIIDFWFTVFVWFWDVIGFK